MLELRERELEELRSIVNEKENELENYAHHNDVFAVENKDLSANLEHLQNKNEENKKIIRELED